MYRQSEKNLLNTDTSSSCPRNMVNFGLLTAEIISIESSVSLAACLLSFCIPQRLVSDKPRFRFFHLCRLFSEFLRQLWISSRKIPGTEKGFVLVRGIVDEILNVVVQNLRHASLGLLLPSPSTPPPQPFYGPFSGTTRVSRCQKRNLCTLWCKGRLTEAYTETIWLGATPSGLTSVHLHHPPPVFYRPDALPAAQPTVSKH